MITQEILKQNLHYNPQTGDFTWIKVCGGVKRGKIAGHKESENDYVKIRLLGKLYKAHRLAWLYVYGTWPKEYIDHINNIKSDNRINNLREATKRQNNTNVGIRSDNTSGFKGVCKYGNKWVSRIKHKGKKIHIGYFDTPEAAHKAYIITADKLHKEFANYG